MRFIFSLPRWTVSQAFGSMDKTEIDDNGLEPFQKGNIPSTPYLAIQPPVRLGFSHPDMVHQPCPKGGSETASNRVPLLFPTPHPDMQDLFGFHPQWSALLEDALMLRIRWLALHRPLFAGSPPNKGEQQLNSRSGCPIGKNRAWRLKRPLGLGRPLKQGSSCSRFNHHHPIRDPYTHFETSGRHILTMSLHGPQNQCASLCS